MDTSRPSAAGGPGLLLRGARTVPFAVAALAVVVAMLAIADHAGAQGERARQAQVRLEHIRMLSQRMDALTWRSLATLDGRTPDGVLAQGVGVYRGMASDLSALSALGVGPARVHALKLRLGAVYGAGMQAALVGRMDPQGARAVATRTFSPAVDALSGTIAAAARTQDATARTAQLRSRIALLGSMAGGLMLLALLAWRLHAIRRRADLEVGLRAVERRGEARLRALFRHSSDVVAVVSPSGDARWLAESVERMLGYGAGDLTGARLLDLVHPADVDRAAAALRELSRHHDGIETMSLRVRGSDGEYRDLESIAENHLGDPDIGGILLNLRDVSDRVALERQLRHQAFHDSLTGLANRALFEDRLTHALVRMRRHAERAAVVFIDLDDFKTVNDSLGHAVGDELLKAASIRVQGAVRTEDTAARLGGDEFAVLLEDLDDGATAEQTAARISAALEEPVMLDGRRIVPSASIGIAYLDETTSATDALGNADVAMYAAKERGKGQVAAFVPAMREKVVERLDLTGDLGTALERDELFLEYQPVVALDTGAVAGVEALVRWNHPVRGRLAPDRFIGIAESTGLIVPIGRWVLETACTQLRRWEEERADLRALELSVNVSTRQLSEPGFPADVREILAATGVAPERVTLEITERLLVDDSEQMHLQLRAIKDIGVRLAVDDFGTGYSALGYLKVFPIDVLKVDRSFVSGIDVDAEKARLVRGIVEMGRSLRLDIVAEGIEEAGEAALLRDFRSRYGQGYLFSRPVAAADIPGIATAAMAVVPERA